MAGDIIDKLKLVNVNDILILNKPDDVEGFNKLSFDTVEKKKKYNVIIVFIFSIDEFIDNLKNVINKSLLYPDGYLYFIYPKKGNKKYGKFIGRDDFFGPAEMNEDGYALKSKLKFNKMVAFDDTFTIIGLKYLEKDKKSTSKPSQRVSDYVDRIPELKEHFAGNKKLLELFEALTPGYKSDWARFVFSSRSEETIKKRFLKMEEVLKEGYKSIDLYRMNKK